MKRRLTSIACWVIGAIAGFALESLAYRLGGLGGVMAVAAFVAAEAYRIHIWTFSPGFPAKPLTFAILFLFLGPLVVAWYFGLRLKIWAGLADVHKPDQRFPGYIQPWRNMRLR
jgi:hypothetical protein